MKEELRRLLTDLTSLQGVGGQEGPVVRYLKDALSPLADRVEVDPSGNLYAFKKGRSERTLLLIAHTDEIGCIVSGIDERGFIRFTRVGGVRDNWLPACRVSVGGVFGVVGVRPGHLMSEEEERKVLPTRELFIDVGANSREEVEALGIGIGSPITFESPLTSFHNPDLVCGKAIDDRLGCALVVLLLRELKGEQLPWSLCAAAAVQEEVGLRGARMAAERVKPECAIVLDTIAGGGTPDVDPEKDVPLKIGEGPVLSLADQSRTLGRGYFINPRMKELLEGVAQRNGIALQRAASLGFYTTDAARVYLSGAGVPTAVLAVPRRYSHTPVEVLDLRDALGALRLVSAFVRELGPDEAFDFLTATR